MIIAYPFIQCTKLGMTYTNDARIASLNITHHHNPRAWEQVVGNWAHSQASGMRGPHYEMKKLNTWAKGWWAAHDTLPQALWHDLVVTALFKKPIHG